MKKDFSDDVEMLTNKVKKKANLQNNMMMKFQAS